jgi:hypothetical protein
MKVLRLALIFSVLTLTLAAAPWLSAQSAPSFNILTWQIDVGRTGQNLSETTLTTSSVQTGNFGQLCNVALDGQVYAQPLVVTNVTLTVNGIPTNYPSVAYVATQNGTLYAIERHAADFGTGMPSNYAY